MRTVGIGLLMLVMVPLSAWAQAEDAAQADPPAQTGAFTATFDQRSPLSDPDEMVKIARWDRAKMPAYAITDHSFQMIVPETYDGSEAYGLLVFIHPNSQVDLNRIYGQQIKKVLAEKKLIWVSYNKAGNEVLPNIRLGLALDSVHNVKQRYKVDGERVYVSGLSGGGRMTCMAGVYYPQVFTGAVPIVGTLYFRDVKVPEDPELRALMRPKPPEGVSIWPRRLFRPTTKLLRQMKVEQRWVLLAGEKDYNMPQMRAHFEQGFKKDGFEQAHYLEIKGMGHSYPDADSFAQALVLLDQAVAEIDPADLPPADERTQRIAQKRLEVALRTLGRSEERGVRALERLIDEFPNTTAAAEAREKLKALEAE